VAGAVAIDHLQHSNIGGIFAADYYG